MFFVRCMTNFKKLSNFEVLSVNFNSKTTIDD